MNSRWSAVLCAVLAVGCGKESESEQSAGLGPSETEVDDGPPTEAGERPAPAVALLGCALRATENAPSSGSPAGDEKELGGGTSGPQGTSGIGTGLGGHGAGAPAGGYRALPDKEGHVSIRMPTVTGELPKQVARRVLRQHLPRMRYCYEKTLVTHPAAKGKAVAELVVDTKGNVSAAKVQGMGSPLDQCLATAMRSMVFPAPKGGGMVMVNATMEFTLREPRSTRTRLGIEPEREVRKKPPVKPDAGTPVPDMAALVVALRAELQPLRDCYERALDRDPSLSGALHLDITVAADGTVAEARPSSSPPSAMGGGLEACAIETMKSVKLTTWQGGSQQVTCTFTFGQGDQARARDGAAGRAGAGPATPGASEPQP